MNLLLQVPQPNFLFYGLGLLTNAKLVCGCMPLCTFMSLEMPGLQELVIILDVQCGIVNACPTCSSLPFLLTLFVFTSNQQLHFKGKPLGSVVPNHSFILPKNYPPV